MQTNSKKLLIGFYAAGLPFHGDTLSESSLGGSETALLSMAKALAARGHDVKVFNNCPKPGRYDGVDYYNYQAMWREIAPLVEWDVFIVSRDYTFLAQKLNAKLVGLWNHDIATDERQLMVNMWGADFVWCLSDFHVDQFLSFAPKLRPILYKTRNGLDLSLIDAAKARAGHRDPNLFVYGSRPERGLDILLQKTWPKILKDVDSNAQLVLAGYTHEGIALPDHIVEYYKYIDGLLEETQNVERVGNLTKDKWYDLLCRAGQLIYPTMFPEIACILAMEAQACGLPIVTSANFALMETVADKQNLIAGHPKSDEYQNAFVARVKRLHTNEFEYRLTQKKGRHHMEGTYEWATIAQEWEEFFWDQFEQRSQLNGGRNTLKRLVYNSDLLAARWSIEHPELTLINATECAEVIKDVQRSIETHHDDPEQYNEGARVDDTYWERNGRFGKSVEMIKDEFKDRPFTLLDIGCGAGGFLARVLKECPGQVEVMGMDFSKGILERAGRILTTNFKELGDPATFLINQDFMDAPIPKDDELADCVFAGEWLEHQTDLYGALTRLEQFAKPGGRVCLTIPNGPWEAITFHQHPQRFHVSHFEFRDIEELFNPKEFSMQFIAIGVSPIDASLLGNWIVMFKADATVPFGQIDYLRKFKTIRPYQSVSACLIVKDEEDNLSRCLKTIKQQVDEIVVVDTGSSDDTIQIAKKFADKVISAPWPDDFSEARNLSVSHADPTADWIYWMDADEILLNADRLRRYLNTRLFHGYVVTQNHLMLDMPNAKPDVPVRIYRNHMGIKFYGAIHEHCEMGLDVPIEPVLILPDVKIAHYGYVTEAIRRAKCKDRNLDLLKKDREKYPDRMLGIVLMMRDYLNISQWELEEARGQYTDRILKMLQEVVRLHRQYFSDERHMYNELSTTIYQRALAALGRQSLPGIEDSELVPFEVLFALGGAVGGMAEPEQVKRNSFWFLDRDEFQSFIATRASLLANTIKLPEMTKKRKKKDGRNQ